MPDVQEVFEMVTQKVKPERGFVERQRKTQRRKGRNRKIGAFVVVAAIAGVGLFAVIPRDEPSDDVATDPVTASPSLTPDVLGDDVEIIALVTGDVTAGPEFGIDAGAGIVSPDGTKVAYVARTVEGGPEIVHVANIDGSDVRPYDTTESSDGAQGPSWSPDGATIVYQAKPSGMVGDLYLLDVATGDVRQLTELDPVESGFWMMSPTFISDGDAVVFAWPTPTGSGGDLRGDLWSVPITGGDPTRIRRYAGWVDASDDGSRISFSEFGIFDGEITAGDLWVSDADGGNAERLVDGRVTLSRWSPDGTRLLYADETQDRLMIVDLSSDETTPVPAAAVGADWIDDASLMVGID